MKELKRFKKFLIELDELIMDGCYHDDEKDEDIITITEEEAYNYIMKTDEFHLLGSENVKNMIHLFVTDFSTSRIILNNFKAL